MYQKLSQEQKGALQQHVAKRLRELIGSHGDIAVLVEYILVMLTSDKDLDLIEEELRAFLADQSRPFVTWLAGQVEAVSTAPAAAPVLRPAAGAASASAAAAAQAGGKTGLSAQRAAAAPERRGTKRSLGLGSNLLKRAVQDARKSTRDEDEEDDARQRPGGPPRAEAASARAAAAEEPRRRRLGAEPMQSRPSPQLRPGRRGEPSPPPRRGAAAAAAGDAAAVGGVVALGRALTKLAATAASQSSRGEQAKAPERSRAGAGASVLAAAARRALAAARGPSRPAAERLGAAAGPRAAVAAAAAGRSPSRSGSRSRRRAKLKGHLGASGGKATKKVLVRTAAVVEAAKRAAAVVATAAAPVRRRVVGSRKAAAAAQAAAVAKAAAAARAAELEQASSASNSDDEEDQASASGSEEDDASTPPPARRPLAADALALAASSRSRVALGTSPGLKSRAAAVSAAVAAAAHSARASSPLRGAPPPRPRRPAAGAVPPARPAVAPAIGRRTAALAAALLAEARGGDPSGRWHFKAAGAAVGSPKVRLREVAQLPAAAPAPLPAMMAATVVGPAYMLRPVPGVAAAMRPAAVASPMATAAAAMVPAMMLPAAAAVPGGGPGFPRPQSSPLRRNFAPQKWRVAVENLGVFATERLDSTVVRSLSTGEIVESVGPPVTLPNGVVRVEIAHPSSAAYPNPIGWVSHDDTSVGGGRCLDVGPQPVGSRSGNKFAAPGYGYHGGGGGWRPRASPYRPYRPRGPSFGNLTWRPGAAAAAPSRSPS